MSSIHTLSDSSGKCFLNLPTYFIKERCVFIENGIVVDLINHEAEVVGSVPCGFVYVDGQSIGDITESSLKDRRILGEEGFISVIVVIESQTGKIVAGPDIHARGFNEEEPRDFASRRQIVERAELIILRKDFLVVRFFLVAT